MVPLRGSTPFSTCSFRAMFSCGVLLWSLPTCFGISFKIIFKVLYYLPFLRRNAGEEFLCFKRLEIILLRSHQKCYFWEEFIFSLGKIFVFLDVYTSLVGLDFGTLSSLPYFPVLQFSQFRCWKLGFFSSSLLIALLCFAWSSSVGTVFILGKSALNKLLPFGKVSLSKKRVKTLLRLLLPFT